jgi:hypothetical protein
MERAFRVLYGSRSHHETVPLVPDNFSKKSGSGLRVLGELLFNRVAHVVCVFRGSKKGKSFGHFHISTPQCSKPSAISMFPDRDLKKPRHFHNWARVFSPG